MDAREGVLELPGSGLEPTPAELRREIDELERRIRSGNAISEDYTRLEHRRLLLDTLRELSGDP